VLDDASGKWGIRVTRVEIKAIDPPKSVKDAMEKQMRAEREKRAAILTAEGVRQSKILTAEGEKQSAILSAEGARQSAILRAEGQAQAIATVFQAVHDNDPDPKLLAYQYLQTLPQIAQGAGSTFWVIPSEVTSAMKAVADAFGGGGETGAAAEPGTAAGNRARRDHPAVTAAENGPAIAPASAAGALPGPQAAAAETGQADAGGSAAVGQVPDVSDAVSAMLTAAIPGASFADPLGAIDYPAADGPQAQADVPAADQEADPPSANGSEAAG
jgi:SPFH domain/Band 7 family protein